MASKHATGHVRVVSRKGRDVFYAKLKVPRGDGTTYEPQRRLGKVWTKRSKPPAGYLTRTQAEARLQAILEGDDALVNVEPPSDVVTFQRACDEHLRYLEHDKQRKPSYLSDTSSVIRAHLLPYVGKDTDVASITTADIDGLREGLLKRGLAHATTQKVLVTLSGILGRAQRKEWITDNPFDKAEKVTVSRDEDFNVLSVEQVQAVARQAQDDLMAAIIIVAAYTGLRQGELLALRWRHVDFTSLILHVKRNLSAGEAEECTPKSSHVRSVPLSDQAIVALDGLSRREHFTGADELVFCNETGGHLGDDVVRTAFYRALEGAGLGRLRTQENPIVFYDLRHVFGTECAAKGIDIRRIQAWLGHADLKTTQRYLHYVPRHDDAALLTAAFRSEIVPPGAPRTGDIRA